jgi:hypothetical protein
MSEDKPIMNLGVHAKHSSPANSEAKKQAEQLTRIADVANKPFHRVPSNWISLAALLISFLALIKA